MSTPLVRNWTFWINETKQRMFLVIDIPASKLDDVVLMEIKRYRPDEERKIEKIDYCDWVVMTEESKVLKECVPGTNTYLLIKK